MIANDEYRRCTLGIQIDQHRDLHRPVDDDVEVLGIWARDEARGHREGDGMIMAMWDEPDDDIGIHHYKVNVTGADGFDLTMGTGSADTEFAIMNLMNGVEYTVKVAAIGMVPGSDSADVDGDGDPDRLGPYSDTEKATPMMAAVPTPALPLFGAFALGAGLLAAGRRRLRRRQELLTS